VALAATVLASGVYGNPLICQIVGRVREDEARHVDFGVAALDGLYAGMGAVDRREREDFVLDACALLRTQFHPTEVWEHFGLDPAAARACYADSPDVAAVHSLVFCRVVPDLHRLGLLTPRIRVGLEAMGVLRFGRPDRSPPGAGATAAGAGAGAAACGPGTEASSGVPDGFDVHPGGVGVDASDPLLALRAALGCVEQIPPEPVLTAMSGLVTRHRLGGVPAARIRLEVSGREGGAWLVTVGEGGLAHRRAEAGDEAEVTIRMDGATWTELVAGRSSMPAALAGGRIEVTGDVFKARALEALL
jgi:hypothetical protein